MSKSSKLKYSSSKRLKVMFIGNLTALRLSKKISVRRKGEEKGK